MKRIVIYIIAIIVLSTSCSGGKSVISFPIETIDSITVVTHELETNSAIRSWVFEDEDMQDFLVYFDKLSGEKVTLGDIPNGINPIYSITFGSEVDYEFLLIGDYLVTYEDKIYRIDGEKTQEVCKSINRIPKEYEYFIHVNNHRFISLVDNNWDSRYMLESKFDGSPLSNVSMSGELVIGDDDNTFNFLIENNGQNTIEYGSKVFFESYVDGSWYVIEDMLNEDILIAWNDLLYSQEPDTIKEDKFYFGQLTPLPVGKYRLVKEVDSLGETSYVSHEFEIQKD